jgi:hypothetical protein
MIEGEEYSKDKRHEKESEKRSKVISPMRSATGHVGRRGFHFSTIDPKD